MSHIYICYSRPNKSYADYLAEDLGRRGFKVWIDDRTNLDKEHLLKIVKAIQESDAFLLISSAIAEESNLVQRETDFAIKNEKPFYILMLQGDVDGDNAYDVRDGSLPPDEFYDKLKVHSPIKVDPTITDDLFTEDEDLFGDLDLDSLDKVPPSDEKVSIEEVDMDALLSEPPLGSSKQGDDSGKRGRKRSRLILGGVGAIILLLLIVFIAVLATQDKEEPKVVANTDVPTATITPEPTDIPTNTPTRTPTDEPSTDTPEPSATSTRTHTPAPSLTPVPFWLQPVLANEDWEPVVQEFDDVAMVLVPPGCFTMGSTEAEIDIAMEICRSGSRDCDVYRDLGDEAFQDEAPAHEICFAEAFWIDQFEVTKAQYEADDSLSKGPQGGFSGVKALEYCASRDVYLPSEAEWEYAASGPSNWLYTWGMEYEKNQAISADSTNALPKPVGSLESTSWVGAYDMIGNIWEWTSTIYLPYPYEYDDAHENLEDLESLRVMRGGGFRSQQHYLRTSARVANVSDKGNASAGARCAREFQESDIAD